MGMPSAGGEGTEAQTVGELRARLAGLPDDMPLVLDDDENQATVSVDIYEGGPKGRFVQLSRGCWGFSRDWCGDAG